MNFSHSAIFHMESRSCLKLFVHDCGFISISAFASLLGITIGIAISIIGSQICPITSGYKSVIKKKKKRHGKISLLAKANLNSVEALFCKVLTESYISHNGLFGK